MNFDLENIKASLKKIFIIAEIGINHNGSLEIAKKLIDMAKRCGCDAVKFQKRDIFKVYTKQELDIPRESPWGTTQLEQKKGLEFNEEQYNEIDLYCKKIGIIWFASAWDENSLKFLEKYNLQYNKIASAMITKLDFLEQVSKYKIHTFISTGMTGLEDIEKAIKIFKKNNCEFSLMHTVSAYPCPEDQLNLSNILYLKEKFKCNVGYSGHEVSVSPSIMAAMFGSTCIERHITLDRSMYGSDQAASLEEPGLKRLVTTIRKLPSYIGSERNSILECEINVAKKLRYWER